MLEIQNVSKTFNAGTVNEKTALNGLNLKLNEGDFVTVIGGNGAGKSTMLNAVAGVWPVDCGKIIIDGVDVTRLGEHQRAAYIGRVHADCTHRNDYSLILGEFLVVQNDLRAAEAFFQSFFHRRAVRSKVGIAHVIACVSQPINNPLPADGAEAWRFAFVV